MLIDLAKPQAPAPAVQDLRARLRLPEGFAIDAAQQRKLEGLVTLALRVIEERTGHAVLRRAFALRSAGWNAEGALFLPRQPLHAIETVEIERETGGRETLTPADWSLVRVRGETALRLSRLPADGFAEVRFEAGHGADWLDAPEDLRQAVVEVAATYFEPPVSDAAPPLSAAAAALLAPYRRIRL
jgi:uncharacterized phiE125 gp8 family phage protein